MCMDVIVDQQYQHTVLSFMKSRAFDIREMNLLSLSFDVLSINDPITLWQFWILFKDRKIAKWYSSECVVWYALAQWWNYSTCIDFIYYVLVWVGFVDKCRW